MPLQASSINCLSNQFSIVVAKSRRLQPASLLTMDAPQVATLSVFDFSLTGNANPERVNAGASEQVQSSVSAIIAGE